MRQVFAPRNAERNLDGGLVVFLDAEFNLSRTRRVGPRVYKTVWPKHPFLSYTLAWENHVARIGPMLTDRKIQEWNLDRLLKWILRCLREWHAPVKKRIIIIAHWAISEVRFVRGIEEEDIFAPTTSLFRGHIEDKKRSLNWWIKDSFGIFGTSLAKLTEDTPFPKYKITQKEREDPYLHWRKRRRHFWKYAQDDVISLQWSTKHWRTKVWGTYGVDILRCLTTATIGKRIFQTKYQGNEPLEPYVSEHVTTKSGKPTTEYYFNPDLWQVRRLAMQCYWGGRRETFIRGVVHGLIRHYDFVKLYMTSAALCPIPSPRSEFKPITSLNHLEKPGWVHIKHFRFKPEIWVPVLPVFNKRFRKLIYPLEGESYCTTFEAREAAKLGAELGGISGYYFTEPYDDRVSKFMQELLR